MELFCKGFVRVRLDTQGLMDGEDFEEERQFVVAEFLGHFVADEGGVRGEDFG